MKSKLRTEKGICFHCGRHGATEKHHIFGASNRNWSEKEGLFVYLCHFCHNEPPDGVHFNRENDLYLKRLGQIVYEESHSREEFMKNVGRNYESDD